MALFQIRQGSTSAKGTLAAGELYDNTELQTLQLGIDGTTEVTLMTSASIVNTISASLESTILNVSSSLSTSIGLALNNLTGQSASIFTTINNLSASVYSTDSTEITNISIASASAWGAFQSASSYSGSITTTINGLSSSIYALDITQSSNITNLTSKTGSYATTGSNQFVSNQFITGNLEITSGSDTTAGNISLNGRIEYDDAILGKLNDGAFYLYVSSSHPWMGVDYDDKNFFWLGQDIDENGTGSSYAGIGLSDGDNWIEWDFAPDGKIYLPDSGGFSGSVNGIDINLVEGTSLNINGDETITGNLNITSGSVSGSGNISLNGRIEYDDAILGKLNDNAFYLYVSNSHDWMGLDYDDKNFFWLGKDKDENGSGSGYAGIGLTDETGSWVEWDFSTDGKIYLPDYGGFSGSVNGISIDLVEGTALNVGGDLNVTGRITATEYIQYTKVLR